MSFNLCSSVLYLLDDILTYSDSRTELIESSDHFFEACVKYSLKRDQEKFVLCSKAIPWYRCQVSAEGIRFDPYHSERIVDMEPTITVSYLEQFVCII